VNVVLKPAKHLRGEVRLPGDKSITHRAMMISALADGMSEIVGFSSAADPMSTLACLRALGVEGRITPESLHIDGRGLRNCRNPSTSLMLETRAPQSDSLLGFSLAKPLAQQSRAMKRFRSVP